MEKTNQREKIQPQSDNQIVVDGIAYHHHLHNVQLVQTITVVYVVIRRYQNKTKKWLQGCRILKWANIINFLNWIRNTKNSKNISELEAGSVKEAKV